ncbi:MAG: AsmA family protein [Acidobacteriota bacterium]|nr:AsmA family protein [Acidobacteriota bacterium]
MSNLRNSWKLGVFVAVLLVAAQVCLSLAVRTHRVHNYLGARLESAFGRPVHVKHFNLEILPSPRIYATGVTVGEDPAFGYEYFLRAEHLTAGLRWSGFLRGRFEFGTLSLGQPSLTLVRSREGRWNLEDWLPPAQKSLATPSIVYGPGRPPAIANHLQKIEFDEGRIDFKSGDVKQPFALTAVAGTVEQISTGRWQLQLEAQPWRSGVALQSTGTVQVRGDIAGTSARLQPASLTVRWDKVSLADLFRLLRGRDYGVRGTFALEATAKSGAPITVARTAETGAISADVPYAPGDWSFSLRASANQMHRWDLTERTDNPDLTARVQGRVNVGLQKLSAESILVESPSSNLHGTAQFSSAAIPAMQVRFDTVAVQASDVLSWYRAFRPGVAEGISVEEFFSGAVALEGWPVKFQQVDLSTPGGIVRVKGVENLLKIGPIHAVLDQERLVAEPVQMVMTGAASTARPPTSISKIAKRHAPGESVGEVSLAFLHDFSARAGRLGIHGRVDNAGSFLKIASAFGNTLNHGWDLTGPARADLRREWSAGSPSVWNGAAEVNDAQLAAAGLNQPLQLQHARLEWRNGKRAAQVVQAQAFGANWSGEILEYPSDTVPGEAATWNVQLHADRLDATELDRWVGPRARPGWLQRLLPSLLGVAAAQTGPASELVRRLKVSGEVQVDEFTIEKLSLQQLHVRGSLQDLRLQVSEGRALCAGGNVRATMLAKFLPRPVYDLRAELDRVNLSQLPIDPAATDRLGGVASGTLHLKTAGVGRDELLQKLTATGQVQLANLEFRGWDLNASVADGEAHRGISRWASGEAAFTVLDRHVILDDVRLDGGARTTVLNGTVSFARDADLSVESSPGRRALRSTAAPGHILKIVGPLDGPRISREKSTSRQPAG